MVSLLVRLIEFRAKWGILTSEDHEGRGWTDLDQPICTVLELEKYGIWESNQTTSLNDSTFQSVANLSLLEGIDPSIYYIPTFVLGTVVEIYLHILSKEASADSLRIVPCHWSPNQQIVRNAEALEKEYEDENRATSKFGTPPGQEYISNH